MDSKMEITGFALPEDGWFHIAVPGEWPHKPTGLLQVIDETSMQSIVDTFSELGQQPNWPGILVDFDHQSLDVDKPSVAAGWITSLEKRPTGVWAQIRWSDLGKKSIEGGRYRFISPVWRSSDCDRLEGDRIRPMKLMNCAVTNEPNIRGLFPLSNTADDLPQFAPPSMPIWPVTAIVVRRWPPRLLNRREELAVLRNYRSPTTGDEWIGGAPWGSRPGGGPRTTRDHDSRVSSFDRQLSEMEAQRQPRPVRGDYTLRDWRATRDRLLKAGANSTTILEAIAADKAHNKQVREQINQIKRDLKKVYKTPAARERAYQRRMDHETRLHEKAVRDWEKNEDRITREVRRIESRRDEEIAKSKDSELKAQAKEADQALKISMQNQKLFARAALEEQKTNRQRELVAAREQRRIDEANERDRRAAKTQEERARREALRMDPVKTAQYEKRRVSSYWDAVQRGDWQSAQNLFPGANHLGVQRELSAIRKAASNDRGRAALLLKDMISTAPMGAYPQPFG